VTGRKKCSAWEGLAASRAAALEAEKRSGEPEASREARAASILELKKALAA
jgi:hypothetical protein